jgi:hypothetical protein
MVSAGYGKESLFIRCVRISNADGHKVANPHLWAVSVIDEGREMVIRL